MLDENARPGGQLFKQIHKFFGAKEHKAGVRGFSIGQQLLDEATALGVAVELNAAVSGVFEYGEVDYTCDDTLQHCKGDNIIIVISSLAADKLRYLIKL